METGKGNNSFWSSFKNRIAEVFKHFMQGCRDATEGVRLFPSDFASNTSKRRKFKKRANTSVWEDPHRNINKRRSKWF